MNESACFLLKGIFKLKSEAGCTGVYTTLLPPAGTVGIAFKKHHVPDVLVRMVQPILTGDQV